jgi:replication factor A1
MTSETENETQANKESPEAKIEELKPGLKQVTVLFKVVEKGEVREVVSRRSMETHRVADSTVGDETGTVKVPLWDDSIETIEIGKTYRLENGYTGLFRGNLQLKMGRHSELKESEKDIETVNRDVDLSAKDYHDSQSGYYRRPYRGSVTYGHATYSERNGNRRRSRHDRYGRRRRSW